MRGCDGRKRDSTGRAKDRGAHSSKPSHADEIAEATGAIGGILFGAGIGSAAGPVGALIGGVAGAIGGWWAGRALGEAASSVTHEDEDHFRAHYDSQTDRPADRAYDDVRGAYYLGQIASHNPNFIARTFDEVEPELERGWAQAADSQGSWTSVRPYAAEGFSRGRSKLDDKARRGRADLEEERAEEEEEEERAEE